MLTSDPGRDQMNKESEESANKWLFCVLHRFTGESTPIPGEVHSSSATNHHRPATNYRPRLWSTRETDHPGQPQLTGLENARWDKPVLRTGWDAATQFC